MAIPRQASVWDARRNSSQVFPVSPDALDNARRALAAWKRSNPAEYAWVVEGAPRLTEDEHVSRFGAAYKGVRAKR